MGQLTNVPRQEKIWERQRKRNQRGERTPQKGGGGRGPLRRGGGRDPSEGEGGETPQKGRGERTPQKRWYPLSQPGYQNQKMSTTQVSQGQLL